MGRCKRNKNFIPIDDFLSGLSEIKFLYLSNFAIHLEKENICLITRKFFSNFMYFLLIEKVKIEGLR